MSKYSIEKDSEKSAKAYGYELRCSPKDSMNIAYAVRGMTIDDAKKFLEDIIEMKRPLSAVFHNHKVHHKKVVGPGSYPVKAATFMLNVIKNAENNAEYKGFDVENMKITHISAYRGRTLQGYMPRAHGRATDKNEQTTNIEVIIEEAE